MTAMTLPRTQPPAPPAGLSWCPACIGALAERMGAIDLFAAELAGVTR